MKKFHKILIVLAVISVLLCGVFFASCSKADLESKGGTEYNEVGDDADSTASDVNIADRKIIYRASASLYADDLSTAAQAIKDNLAADEWCDEESVSGGYAFFIVRVKSTRLDAFLDAIDSEGRVANLRKTATDVSLSYQNTANRIASLEAETARLNALYESASISDMILINERLSAINLELGYLQGTLNEYDSLVDYSEVTISIYENEKASDKTFGEMIAGVFKGAWKALGTVFKGLLIVVVAVFPFAVVFVPIGGGVVFAVLFCKKRKAVKNSKKNNNGEQK